MLHGANRIVAVIVEYLVLASVSVVGIQTLWEIIKSIGIQNYGQKEMLNRVLTACISYNSYHIWIENADFS